MVLVVVVVVSPSRCLIASRIVSRLRRDVDVDHRPLSVSDDTSALYDVTPAAAAAAAASDDDEEEEEEEWRSSNNAVELW